MGLFKCKMCGAELPVTEGAKIVECEYCGTSQTIATSNDDKILKLYARGNLLRTQNEFDKAYSIFEQIVVENPKDAEAYWNLLLCKYGVTYVDDYDGSKKPTISRMSMTSIKEDVDYKNVIEYADEVTKKVYEKQINEISLIQENILNIVKKEKPYDIFISYKETDEYGNRTEDSVLAQEIYDTLTKEGYKVFLSRITLANAIGSEYEPYIYAALYSSKIMLLVTTSEEYVNAVWVRNEWSRFLKMMKEDSSKKIIPCFKTIDPYDLPKEIRNIQSVNFDKLGAIQDLVIGVNKILTDKSIKNENEYNSKIDNLLKRSKIYIEDKDFEEAEEILEDVLDEDAECAEAYMLLFMAKNKFSSLENALIYAISNKEDKYYSKVEKYASEEYKSKLNEMINNIQNKINNKKNILKENGILPSEIIPLEPLRDCMNLINFDGKITSPVKNYITYKNVNYDGIEVEQKNYNETLKEYYDIRKFFVKFEEIKKIEVEFTEYYLNFKMITFNQSFEPEKGVGFDSQKFFVIYFSSCIKEIYNCLFPNLDFNFEIRNRDDKIISPSEAYLLCKELSLQGRVYRCNTMRLNDFYLGEEKVSLLLEEGRITIECYKRKIALDEKMIMELYVYSETENNFNRKFFDIYCLNKEKQYTKISLSTENGVDLNLLKQIKMKCRSDEYNDDERKLIMFFNNYSIPVYYCNDICMMIKIFGKDNYIPFQDFCFDTNMCYEFNGGINRERSYLDDLFDSSNVKTTSSSGCYVATCVYGSYDCSEVWLLRRYRDNYLDNMWWGRIFIQIYYFISPKLVKLFGEKKWFRKPIKKILDRKVKKLKNKGYEDTPYNDKY